MKLPRRQWLHLGATALGILFIVVSSHTARSQAARSIRVIVPFPPGGAADLLARVLADQVGRAQATTVVVEIARAPARWSARTPPHAPRRTEYDPALFERGDH